MGPRQAAEMRVVGVVMTEGEKISEENMCKDEVLAKKNNIHTLSTHTKFLHCLTTQVNTKHVLLAFSLSVITWPTACHEG